MPKLTDIQLAKLHEKSSLHLVEMRLNKSASCFFCLRDTATQNINEWTDCGLTARCPYCHIDAMLPGEYDKNVLEQLHQYSF